jgi:hypothetical protein
MRCQRRGVRDGGQSITVSVRKWLVVSSGGEATTTTAEVAIAIAEIAEASAEVPIAIAEAAIATAEIAIAIGEAAIATAEVPIAAAEVALHGGEVALCGGGFESGVWHHNPCEVSKHPKGGLGGSGRPRKRAGAWGAHHKGACLPSSV